MIWIAALGFVMVLAAFAYLLLAPKGKENSSDVGQSVLGSEQGGHN